MEDEGCSEYWSGGGRGRPRRYLQPAGLTRRPYNYHNNNNRIIIIIIIVIGRDYYKQWCDWIWRGHYYNIIIIILCNVIYTLRACSIINNRLIVSGWVRGAETARAILYRIWSLRVNNMPKFILNGDPGRSVSQATDGDDGGHIVSILAINVIRVANIVPSPATRRQRSFHARPKKTTPPPPIADTGTDRKIRYFYDNIINKI